MGRPSKLRLTAERRDGKVAEIRVAGGAVIACRGEIDVP
jgi:predicted PhzF superfamily epimerase YddE/YHI9